MIERELELLFVQRSSASRWLSLDGLGCPALFADASAAVDISHELDLHRLVPRYPRFRAWSTKRTNGRLESLRSLLDHSFCTAASVGLFGPSCGIEVADGGGVGDLLGESSRDDSILELADEESHEAVALFMFGQPSILAFFFVFEVDDLIDHLDLLSQVLRVRGDEVFDQLTLSFSLEVLHIVVVVELLEFFSECVFFLNSFCRLDDELLSLSVGSDGSIAGQADLRSRTCVFLQAVDIEDEGLSPDVCRAFRVFVEVGELAVEGQRSSPLR